MPEPGRPTPDARETKNPLERLGVAVFLAGLGFLLYRTHTLVAWSEAGELFAFGRHFAAGFGALPLEPGFPLLASGAVRIAGPAYGFLVNALVLLVLVALLYALARALVPGQPELHARLGPVAGGVCVALLFALDGDVLGTLVSPGRDPLAWAMSLAAALLLVRFRRAPESSLVWAAASGVALGLAVSTRTSAIGMLVPFAVYGFAARREIALAKPALCFAAGLAAACLPLVVHSALAGQAPALPLGSPGPRGGLASLVAELSRPGSLAAWALVALGLAESLRRPGSVGPALCLPAVVVAALLPGDDPTAQRRVAVHLFALPLAGAGAAALVHLPLSPLGAGLPGRIAATTLGALAAVAAAAVAVDAGRSEREGFRIEQALALRNHVTAIAGAYAPIFAEGPLASILRCFLERDERVQAFEPGDVLSDAAFRASLRGRVEEAGEGFFVFQSPAIPSYVRSAFEAAPAATFRASTYGLSDVLEPRFLVDRVQAWSRLQSSVTLHPKSEGERALFVDVGTLSSEERDFAKLFLDDELLDDAPRDGANYYRVQVADASRTYVVRLASDRPVTSSLRATLQPLSRPISLRFDAAEGVEQRSRLSAAFFAESGRRMPMLRGGGTMDVPTLAWRDVAFVGVAEVGVRGASGRGLHAVTIGAPGRPLHRVNLRTGETPASWMQISFALYEPFVKADETTLVWSYEPPDTAVGRPVLAVRSLELHRLPLAASRSIRLGAGDAPFLMGGFHTPESASEGAQRRWRWTKGRAELRLPLRPQRVPHRLEVRYFVGARPDSVPPPSPSFLLEGTRLRGARREEPAGPWLRVIESFDLPAGTVDRPVNHLEIRTDTWVPRFDGARPDGRELGIMLESASLGPLEPAAASAHTRPEPDPGAGRRAGR